MSITGIFYPDTLPTAPYSRIVSLVPSLSETVAWLGLVHKLVGRTRFCTSSPALLSAVARVGGTKDPSLERIHALSPDLILAVKEENRQEDIELFAQHYPCLVFDISTVAQATITVLQLAALLGASEEARVVLNQRTEAFLPSRKLSALYLIWQNPYMTIGADTYIADVLRHSGFVLPNPALMRYPEVDIPSFCAMHRVDAIFLSSEPFPFKEAHARQLQASTGIPTYCVDGQLLSWYGTLTPIGLSYGRQLYQQLVASVSDGL